MPKFSIIVPVYKVEKYIRQCIESVINQTFKDFELIAVDDCGGDNSISIVEEYAKKDKRIKILYHEKNKGLAAARNAALDAASGDYILCLDSDDWMDKNCLSVVYREFQLRKTESIWFNTIKYYEDKQKFEERPMYPREEGYRVLIPWTIAAYSDFTWIKAYTRKSIEESHLRYPEGLTFEDGEFYFKYFTLYPKTYVIPETLIYYRHREGSIVREADKGKIRLEDVYTVLRHLRDFWIEKGVYEDYKLTLMKLLQNRLRMCRGLNYSEKNKKLSYDILNDMNFPEDFKQYSTEFKDSNPLVSVVIPIYNVEKYVSECLTSVINQTYKNLEIICVDDCGQDNSIKIVEDFATKDNRIKIIRHNKK